LWGFSAQIGPLEKIGGAARFSALSSGANWQTSSTVFLCDHNDIVEQLTTGPLLQRILSGYVHAARVALQGGFSGYFRHAWRFGLFFVFPFLLMGLGFGLSLAAASAPWWLALHPLHCLWSLPIAASFFRFVFFPFSERLHTMHLFADWRLALSVASLDDAALARWLEASTDTLLEALALEADEHLISSHSMGASLAAHVLGMALERKPDVLAGRRVVFATLGGAILQCALLKPAQQLRRRVGAIARAPEVSWLEVQCLTDVVHFYKAPVVALCGHKDAPPAKLSFIRMSRLLSRQHLAKIGHDFLRIHRQYVLHADLRGSFDFALLTTGPFPADLTSDLSKRDFAGLSDGQEATYGAKRASPLAP
jgi:hypothetical protein